MSDLRGDLVRLRARHEADVPILDTELHDDVALHARMGRRPWRPISPGTEASPYRVKEPRAEGASFSVVELACDTLAGTASLWDIDTHNRSAHIGIALRPAFRGKGLATDTVRVLCHYGFVVLGLHRIQIETLADNHPMIKAAEQAGFTKEGILRDAGWDTGGFVGEAVFGILVHEWTTA
ncbi:MAG TPA: GNAT family protein [Pseudonocardiaceae bacterium]|jgi:RimJ/RimL family protein N-acetyltransferase